MSQIPNDKSSRDNRQVAKADAKRILDIAKLLSQVMDRKGNEELEQLMVVTKEGSILDVTKRHD
jgi:hypothetical protein